jgi:two-component system, cell cycle response regulator
LLEVSTRVGPPPSGSPSVHLSAIEASRQEWCPAPDYCYMPHPKVERPPVARKIPRGWRRVSPAVVAVLALLGAWSVAYELADTVLPGWSATFPFRGVAPDVAFVIAGGLLVARGFCAERGWALIGVGALCWAAGDIYWTLALSDLSNPPLPSWADAGYLAFCPLAFAGIFSLVRGWTSEAPKALVADAVAAALGVGALSAAVVVQPVLASAKGGTLAITTNLAYPLVDMLLLGLIVGGTALGNWRLQRTWVLLALSVIMFWIADSLYLITDATGTYQQTSWFNPLWYASPVLAAWAGWLPGQLPFQVSTRRGGIRGIVMPLVFACAALGTLVWSSFAPVGVIAIVLSTMSLLVIMGRLVLTWRENAALLHASQEEALTDALTGLGNRRALALELESRMAREDAQRYVLALFDLDGFKYYNDNFGHPAGDELLRRLGRSLDAQLTGQGEGYRMGGDEFCALIDAPLVPDECVREAAAALSERGEGFDIGCSYGSILLPNEAQSSETALRIADQRLYAQKRRGRASASRQSTDVLMRALDERNPDLGHHMRDVADYACRTAESLSLSVDEIEQIRQAAELHDVGKVAIPDAILQKPGPLTDSEWEFIRRHTLIGERIIAAAPALRQAATLVRSSHEYFDGSGYPDGLAGEQIPLGSRIITVCDAFSAMTTERPYQARTDAQAAIGEIQRCAGSQFDPDVVEHFCEVLSRRKALLQAA